MLASAPPRSRTGGTSRFPPSPLHTLIGPNPTNERTRPLGPRSPRLLRDGPRVGAGRRRRLARHRRRRGAGARGRVRLRQVDARPRDPRAPAGGSARGRGGALRGPEPRAAPAEGVAWPARPRPRPDLPGADDAPEPADADRGPFRGDAQAPQD